MTGGGGGTAMGGGTGGGGSVDAGQCSWAPCNDATEFCTDTVQGHRCDLRWTGIEIVTPGANAVFNASTSGVVSVVARLVSAPGNDGGGSVPVTAEGQPLSFSSGVYTGQLTFSGERDVVIDVEADAGVASLDASVMVKIDTVRPTAALVPTAPPVRARGDGGVLDVDPAIGFDNAYKKDEVVELRVEASEPITVTASNFPSTFGPALSLRGACSTCTMGKTCTCFDLDLAKVSLNAIRGEIMISASAMQDLAGNSLTSAAAASLPVTRHKWRRVVAPTGYTVTTPAIGPAGRIYVGTGLATGDGRLVAVAPSGQLLDGFDAGVTGWVTAGPLLSGSSVYVATRDATTGRIRKFDAQSGALLGEECSSATYNFNSSLALTDLGQAPEAVVAIATTGDVVAARVGAASAVCRTTSLSATTQRYSVVAMDGWVFAANSQGGAVARIPWLSSTQQWGSSTTNNTTLFTQALVAFGTTVGGGGGGVSSAGVYALQADAGFSQRADYVENASNISPAGAPVVGGTVANPRFFYGNNAPAFVRVDYTPGDPGSFDGGTAALSPPAQGVVAAPVVGDLEVYVVDNGGNLGVYEPVLLGRLWSSPNAGTPGAAHPNLDVARDAAGNKACGRGGVLYVPASDGSLSAFIVDSNGVKANAPWPRWQHDPAATGNPATSLLPWSCP